MNYQKLLLITIFLPLFGPTALCQDLLDGHVEPLQIDTNKELHALAIAVEKFSRSKSDAYSIFSLSTKNKITNKSKSLEAYSILKLSEESLFGLLKRYQKSSYVKLEIPTRNKSGFELLLQPVSIFTKDVIFKTAEGKDVILDKSKYAFFNGIIHGDKSSFVSMSITPSGVKMVLSDKNGNYNITKIKGSKDEYIFFNDNKVKESSSFSCENELDVIPEGPFISPDQFNNSGELNKSKLKTVRSRVEVDIEIDYDLYEDHDYSSTETLDWGIDVMTAAINWYQMEFVSLALSQITIWTSNTDPFNNLGNDEEAMGDLLKDWAASRNPHGDITHYLTTELGFGGRGRGKANGIGGFCDPIDNGFLDDATSHCISAGLGVPFALLDATENPKYSFEVPSWTMEVFCHEMGHVFGSPHTHNCGWGPSGFSALDNCENTEGPCDSGPAPSNGGTMMSYCDPINLSKGFHSEPGHLIRTTINESSCLNHSEESCPELTTIVNAIDNNWTYDAKKTIFVYDGSVSSGFSPTLSSGDKVIIYGDFQIPSGAGVEINDEGCN